MESVFNQSLSGGLAIKALRLTADAYVGITTSVQSYDLLTEDGKPVKGAKECKN